MSDLEVGAAVAAEPEKDAKKKKKGTGIVVSGSTDEKLTFVERRQKNVEAAVAALAKKYGAGSIGLVSKMTYQSQPRIPSGIFILDFALGGGWARGRINLLWGNKSSSKTTTVLRAIANAQKLDLYTNRYIFELEGADLEKAVPLKCAFIDVEGTFDAEWAASLGVDNDALLYARPQTSEEAAEVMEILLKQGVNVIALDSIAAMVPAAELEGGIEDYHVGVQARLMSKLFRKLQSIINTAANEDPMSAPTIFLLNQLRNKIGVMFGSPEVKPGGVAQDFYTTIEVKLSPGKMTFYDGKEATLPKHNEFSFKIEKNKVSPPKIQGSYCMQLVTDDDLDLKVGDIDEIKEVMKFAEKLGIYGKDEKTNKFMMYGKPFKSKGEIVDAYYLDKQQYLLLKKDILKRLVPKQ